MPQRMMAPKHARKLLVTSNNKHLNETLEQKWNNIKKDVLKKG